MSNIDENFEMLIHCDIQNDKRKSKCHPEKVWKNCDSFAKPLRYDLPSFMYENTILFIWIYLQQAAFFHLLSLIKVNARYEDKRK